MIKNERFDTIMEILKQEKYSTPNDLAKRLYVSPVTIRRDLKKLESDGLVRDSACQARIRLLYYITK